MSQPPLPPLQLVHSFEIKFFIYISLPLRCFNDFGIPSSLFFLFGNTLDWSLSVLDLPHAYIFTQLDVGKKALNLPLNGVNVESYLDQPGL